MADHTLHLGHRLMLYLILTDLAFNLRMTVEADLARLSFDEIGLIGTMRTVTGEAVALGKRRMGGLFSLFGG